MEAIILAGGFGTRVSRVIKDVPKPMASIKGKPFLQYVLNYIIGQDITRVILSVGYKKEVIQDFFSSKYNSLLIDYCEESEPLGTGGAIKKALSMALEETVFVINGDSMFKIDYHQFYKDHTNAGVPLSIALRFMQDVSRYGIVRTNDRNVITAFLEKQSNQSGAINGGIYLIKKDFFTTLNLPKVFSFEKDVMEKQVGNSDMAAFCYEGYFIDIGVPEDYNRAIKEL